MKHLYIVRRHRLAPDRYQGTHRKVPAYAKEYEVIFATSEVEIANHRKTEAEMQPRMSTKPAPFKYSIVRVKIESMHKVRANKTAREI